MTALKAFSFLLPLYFHPASFACLMRFKTLVTSEDYHAVITVSFHNGIAG
jgi:hypothetical protein